MVMKVCIKCKIHKPLDAFHRNKRVKDGYQSWCIECRKIYDEENKDAQKTYFRKIYDRQKVSPIHRAARLVADARKRAKMKGETFQMSKARIEVALLIGKCERTGIEFQLDGVVNGIGRNPFAPSIDKIDPNKSYSDINIQVVVWAYNIGKYLMTNAEYERYILTVAEHLKRKAENGTHT